MSEDVFEKHDYSKSMKQKIKPLEDFVRPQTSSFHAKANMLLPDLLEKLKGEKLCVSLLLDPSYHHWEDIPTAEILKPSSHNIPDSVLLRATISAFRQSLMVTEYEVRCIEKTQECNITPHYGRVLGSTR